MKEREQLVIFNKLREGAITQRTAAEMLKVSPRWIRKKFKRFCKLGDVGIVHQARGRRSPKTWNDGEKKLAMKLFEEQFAGFGPTFAAEKLKELYGIKINRETLRQTMIGYGHWKGRSRKPKHRKWRERKEYFGVLIQLDGSPHDWFEGRGPKCTLLVFIDDATSIIVWAELVPSESVESVMQATRRYIERHGRPLEFYVDFGSVFSVNTNNPDRIKITQFKRACGELGIDVSYAHSPQAKGRVERSNKTHQDRLVKELRLRNISTMDEANAYIRDCYISTHNKAYAVNPAKEGDVHKSIINFNLDKIFCLKEERIIQNDFTIQYKKRVLQILSDQKAVVRPKESVVVSEQFDGNLSVSIRKIPLKFIEIERKPIKIQEKVLKQYAPWKPAADHPWRRYSPVTKTQNKTQINGGY
jgi:transposase